MSNYIPTRPQPIDIYEGISLAEVGNRNTLNAGLARADEYIDYLLAENARLAEIFERIITTIDKQYLIFDVTDDGYRHGITASYIWRQCKQALASPRHPPDGAELERNDDE